MPLTKNGKTNYILGRLGIFSLSDVINHLPRKYDSYAYTKEEKLRNLEDKERIVIYGEPITPPKTIRFAKMSNTSFIFRDQYENDYSVIAWNRPYLPSIIKMGEKYTIQANFDKKRHVINLLGIKKGRIPEEESIKPIYSLPDEIKTNTWNALLKKAFNELEGQIFNVVPAYFKTKYRLLDKYDALLLCHFPSSLDDVRRGQRVLKYEEALLFCLKNQLIRQENKALTKIGKGEIDKDKLKDFISHLEFELTSSQKTAVKEIIEDMSADSLMYRLLQGDVGTGKTLVAAIALYANFLRGAQGAIMAPTETLAKQHYETIKEIFSKTKVNVTLLHGKMDASDRRGVLEDIKDQTADIIVGTHALFSKSVIYNNLGLVIIDEQHKFGVNQRNLLASKGDMADVLLMSATPIPRTLSLTIYGDLDVSTLHDFPNQKRDVTTKIIRSSNSHINEQIQKAIDEDKRIYVIAPRIEYGEDENASVQSVYDMYEKAFPGKVCMLHGKMDDDNKEAALIAFKSGLCPILVSTSVVEVGVDVKKASLMFIYEAASFSLSSLHQLRGRIGRDGSKAKCLLVYDGNDPDDFDKLKVLENSEDGFEIAEEDLRRRGPGEIAGVKQSGLPDFQMVNIVADFKMFEAAREDAAFILRNEDQVGFSYILKKARKEIETVTLG